MNTEDFFRSFLGAGISSNQDPVGRVMKTNMYRELSTDFYKKCVGHRPFLAVTDYYLPPGFSGLLLENTAAYEPKRGGLN
ncbi:hypothetical protein HY640_05300 [Candidatus Woesearchaeota archaeon]|nr:hypothetical protein [Candidatus Woesearchaeota archaeon]